MIRREGDRLIIPLDERGRVVLTDREWARVIGSFRRVHREQGPCSKEGLWAAFQALVPEESNGDR